MRPLIFLFLLLSPFTLFSQANTVVSPKSFNLPAGISDKDYLPNTIIIKFKKIPPDGKISIKSAVIQSINTQSVSINEVRQLFKQPETAATSKEDAFGLNRIVEVKYDSTENIESVINQLLNHTNVEYAEPQYIYHSKSIPNANDQYYIADNQHYLTQVHAPSAWNIATRSSTPTIIAIIDSGSQLDHPDLAANIYHNEADPIDGIDNDGDGYIDNYNGWDFAGCCKNNPTQDNKPDINSIGPASHGVHISGLASAVTNNNIGIASVAYNTAQLLIIKASADDLPEDIIAGYEGIKYAVDHGAKIINCSWGGVDFSPYAQNIINYAIGNDCLIVAATGNFNRQVDYPAAYPGVLAVTAVTRSDKRYTRANYGSQVSVSAPGEAIYSTSFNTYVNETGTSMATAIVSSAAALIKSTFPSWTMQQVAEQIKNTADNIDSNNPDFAGLLGTGRLNVWRAIASAITPTVDSQPTSLNLMQNYPNPSNSSTTIEFNVPQDGLASLTLYSLLGQPVRQFFNTYLHKGSQRIPIYVGDLAAGVYIYQLRCGNLEQALKLVVE